MNFLHSLLAPIWVEGIAVVGGGLLLFLGVLRGLSRLVPPVPQGPNEEALAGAKFSMLEPLLGIALFYALGEAALQHHALSNAMDAEMGTLRSLAWSVAALEPAGNGPVHVALDGYIATLIHIDYPTVADGGDSLAGFRALQRLAAAVEAVPVEAALAVPREAARKLVRKAGENREARMSRALLRTPPLLVAIAASLVLLVFVFFWFFDSGGRWGQLLLALMLCAAILTVFFCVLVLYDFFLEEAELVPAALHALRMKG